MKKNEILERRRFLSFGKNIDINRGKDPSDKCN